MDLLEESCWLCFYGKGILELLGGSGVERYRGASFVYEPSAVSMLAGLFGAVVIAFLAMIWATRKQARKEPTELLSNAHREEGVATSVRGRSSKTLLVSLVLFSAACLLFSLPILQAGEPQLPFSERALSCWFRGCFSFERVCSGRHMCDHRWFRQKTWPSGGSVTE